MVRKHETSMGGEKFNFPNTLWDEILAAKNRATDDYRGKMGTLINKYWKPVYIYILKGGWCGSNEDAKDLTQEFFTRFFEKNYLESVHPDKGRFRAFVKGSLKNFLLDKKKEQRTQKRGGDTVKISFDKASISDEELKSTHDPAELFDKEWARSVIQSAMKEMKRYLVEEEKEDYWRVFEEYNISPGSTKDISYDMVAGRLDLAKSDVKNYLYFTRKLLKTMIKDEIRHYISDKTQLEEELKYLSSLAF